MSTLPEVETAEIFEIAEDLAAVCRSFRELPGDVSYFCAGVAADTLNLDDSEIYTLMNICDAAHYAKGSTHRSHEETYYQILDTPVTGEEDTPEARQTNAMRQTRIGLAGAVVRWTLLQNFPRIRSATKEAELLMSDGAALARAAVRSYLDRPPVQPRRAFAG